MKEVNFGDRRPSVGRYAASDASRPETVDCAFGNAGMLTYIRLLSLTNAAGPSVQALAATTAQELASTYWQRFGDFYRQDLHELVPLPLICDGEVIAPAELLDLLSGTSASPADRALR